MDTTTQPDFEPSIEFINSMTNTMNWDSIRRHPMLSEDTIEHLGYLLADELSQTHPI